MGPIFPLLSGLLLNKLDSEELEEDFDKPSCQSPSRQFYFFLVLFHCRQPPLSLRWMSWVPPPQHRLLPSHTGAAALGSHLLKLWWGNHTCCWERETGVLTLPMVQAGAAVWSSLIFGQRVALEIVNKPYSQTWNENPLCLPCLRARISTCLTGFNFLNDSGAG